MTDASSSAEPKQSPVVLSADDLPPAMVSVPGGPRSQEITERFSRVESPAFVARRESQQQRASANMAPIVYASARGTNVYDVDGNRYVDLVAGFGAQLLGHNHPALSTALHAQSDTLWQALGDVYSSEPKLRLMEELAAIYPEKNARVLLGQSGADAVTAALKTAVLHTGKPGLIAFEGSYHGMSYAPLAITSLRAPYRDPFVQQLNPHVQFVRYPRAINDVAISLEQIEVGLKNSPVGAVVIEPILGRGGCFLAPEGLLTGLASLCKKYGALLIVDEIWTGLGRSGSWLYSTQHNVTADLVLLGKGLGGGLALSACVGRDEVMQAWAKGPAEIVHTATFHGAPLACATAWALIAQLKENSLVERTRRLGDWWITRLREQLGSHPLVKQIRGAGLMVGVELISSAHTLRWMREMLSLGYITLTGGVTGETLTLTPPLIMSETSLDNATQALLAGLEQAQVE